MLSLTIQEQEFFDEQTSSFTTKPQVQLQLEHSLVSVSKWEAKWNKPFLSREPKTVEETIDYIKCMTLNKNVSDEVYTRLTNGNIGEVTNYIEAPMTATTIRSTNKGGSREIITSELIYYWMIALNVPFECQKWHLNRLLTLINVCNVKNAPPKKMAQHELMARNAQLNAARKKALTTSG